MPNFCEIAQFRALGGRRGAVQNNKVMDLGPTENDGAGDNTHGTVDDLPVGTELMRGQYTIASYLNSGGFGITYCARDSLGRTVVIKECFPAIMCRRKGTKIAPRKPDYVVELSRLIEQFVSEAHALAALKHKNILHVHQVFEENDTAYMAIDFIDGPDLLDVIENEPARLSAEEIVRVTRRTLGAIKYVHDKNMLHRDISPDNILIDEAGEPVLIDFGSARRAQNVPGRVFSKIKFVKDGYSPQEFYIEGAEQGTWSDLYSFAATMYHAISGAAPIDAQHRMSAVAQEKADPYVPLAGRFDAYPEGFLEAIDHALAIMPADRIQTADEWLGRVPTRPVRILTPASDEPERRTRPTRSPEYAESAALAATAEQVSRHHEARQNETGPKANDVLPEDEAVAPISLALDDLDAEFETEEEDEFEVDLSEFIADKDASDGLEEPASGNTPGFVAIDSQMESLSEATDDRQSGAEQETATGETESADVPKPEDGTETSASYDNGERSSRQDTLDELESAIAETNRVDPAEAIKQEAALDAAIAQTLVDAKLEDQPDDTAGTEIGLVAAVDEDGTGAIGPANGAGAPGRSRKGLLVAGVAIAAILAGGAALQFFPSSDLVLVAEDIAPAAEPPVNPRPMTPPTVSEDAAAPVAHIDTAPAQNLSTSAGLGIPTLPTQDVEASEAGIAPTVLTDVALPASTEGGQTAPAVPDPVGDAPRQHADNRDGSSLIVVRDADAVPPALRPVPRPAIGPSVVADTDFLFTSITIDDKAPAISETVPGVRLAAMSKPGDIADELLPSVDAVPPAPLPPEPLGQIGQVQVTGAHWDVDMPFTSATEQVRNAVTLRITEITAPEVIGRSGDWVQVETILYAFNGQTLRPNTSLSEHILDDLTVDPDGFARATVRYRDATTGRIDRGLLAVPIFRQISLADGTVLVYRVEDGRWIMVVQDTGSEIDGGLRQGDVLLSERTTGIGIANEDALRAVYEQLVATDIGTARFVVERGGIEIDANVPLARLEAP